MASHISTLGLKASLIVLILRLIADLSLIGVE